jgi:hypothetical protein
MPAHSDHPAERHLPDSIASRLPALREIARKHGVRSIAVVGSAAAGGFTPDRSDLDLLVDFGEYQPGLARRAIDFHRETETLFGRRVDILSVHGIRSPHWRALHEACKVPVYAAA